MGTGPSGAVPDQALRGAILESQSGDIFVKMTAPSLLVGKVTPEFDSMISKACGNSSTR